MKFMINKFRGANYYLSNFYLAPVEYKGFVFQNNEAAFQAMKCPSRANEFTNLNPSQAKRLGRHVKMRPDWEFVKEEHMYMICYMKFTQNEELRKKLLSTENEELEEGNTWGDREWGTVNGIGNNKLGKILMNVRDLLRNEI